MALFFALIGIIYFFQFKASVFPVDLDLYVQTFFKGSLDMYAQGRSHWAEHCSPALIPFLLLRNVPPFITGWILIGITVFLVGIGGVVLRKAAEDYGLDSKTVLILEITYWVNPFTVGAALSGFHEMNLALPLLMFAVWKADKAEAGKAVLAALGLCLIREDLCLAAGAIAVILMIRGKKKEGAVLLVLAALTFGIGNSITGHADYRERFANAFYFPFAKKKYLVEIAALILPLTVLAPAGLIGLIPALPAFGLNALASYRGHWLFYSHYQVPLAACYFIACLIAAAKIGNLRKQRIMVGALLGISLLLLGIEGPEMINYYSPERLYRSPPLTDEDIAAVRKIQKAIENYDSDACSPNLGMYFVGRDRFLSTITQTKKFREGDYQVLILDSKSGVPPDDPSLFIETVNKKYRKVWGDDRIHLRKLRTP